MIKDFKQTLKDHQKASTHLRWGTNLILPLLLTLITFYNCEQPKQKSGPEYSEEIKAIIEAKNVEVESLYAEGAIDSVATYYTDNVIQMPPHQPPLMGIEDFTKVWKQNAQIGTWNFDLETQEVHAVGDMATEFGSYILSFSPNENSPIPAMTDKGNYVVVWQKVGDDWKVLWDAPTPTTPMPLPPAMDSIPE